MHLFCPNSACPNHSPPEDRRWYHLHGSYESCGVTRQRYRCIHCGRTFSQRTFSIDYWVHRPIDYLEFIERVAEGSSVRGLSRHFSIAVKSIQNRFGRLARSIMAIMFNLQTSLPLIESLVADGLENFFVSQDFPNNIHLLVGKESQFIYGFNYALMRRTGRRTEEQKRRCALLYKSVDFTSHTITSSFTELTDQMMRVAAGCRRLALYTDERTQYQLALKRHAQIASMGERFTHVRVNSHRDRNLHNPLFSVNYMEREIRKDMPEYHRKTVCFGRNVSNGLERLCVYLYHHNFIKRYRIGTDETRTHAEVAGIPIEEVERIRSEVITKRWFLTDNVTEPGSFFDQLWRRATPTPLKDQPEYLPGFTLA